MKDLLMLKIGGSVCTEKAKGSFRVRNAAVRRIGKEISEARMERDFRLIVVNGAGPFGHVNVKEYDINDGLRKERDFEGFSKTVNDCGYLNWKVSETLRKAGLATLPFPASGVAVQSGKKVISFDMDVIKRLWDFNDSVIPVMNGTMVPDLKLGGSVLSGDSVLEYLAGRLKPKLVISATDVDGIFTADPRKDKKARLIDAITKDKYGDIKRCISGSCNTDVTGGMLGKVERLLDLETKVLILNGNVPGRVRNALLGKEVKGTIIGRSASAR